MKKIEWCSYEPDKSIDDNKNNGVGLSIIDDVAIDGCSKCLSCKNRVQFFGYYSEYMACMKDNGKSLETEDLNVLKYLLNGECKDYEYNGK